MEVPDVGKCCHGGTLCSSLHACCTAGLGRGNSSTVGGNDLRLKGKHFAAVSIHQHFHPMDIVGAVCLVVAKGLHSRKVFQPASLGIEERFINPEIMRVSVHIGDRLLEGNDLVA